MNKLVLGGAAAALALAVIPAFAQTAVPAKVAPKAHVQTRAEVASHVQAMFAKLDSDRNGWLTKAETDAARDEVRKGRVAQVAERRAVHSFGQIDRDGNGSISRAEFDSAHANRVGPATDRHTRRGAHMLGGKMFDTADSNKDSRVSLQEATATALRQFDMADANRDGQVTGEERKAMREKMRAERGRG